MEPIYRKSMVRRIAEARQRRCYVELFKLIVERKVDYTVNYDSTRRGGATYRRGPQEVRAETDEYVANCVLPP